MQRIYTTLLLALALLISAPVAAADSSAFDRVMKSGTLRCGYVVGAPYFTIDAATNKKSGIWYDLTQEMGKWLDLKVEWVEEIGFGEIGAALDSGRIDALCVGIWVNPDRAKAMDFTNPVTYSAVHAYVREGDARFDNNLDKINDPAISIACLDGEMSATIAGEDYPKAKTVCLPQMSAHSEMMMNVSQSKADVLFATPSVVAKYNEKNTPKLAKVKTSHPIRLFAETIAVARGNDDLRRMLSHTVQFLIDSGKVDKIVDKYAEKPEDFIRTAKPYEAAR